MITLEQLKKAHGKRVTCTIDGKCISDAKIFVDNDEKIFICQNIVDGLLTYDRFGYRYSYIIYDANSYNQINPFIWFENFNLKFKVEKKQKKLKENEFECSYCQEVFSKTDDDSNDPDGHSLCQNCFNEKCIVCSNCGDIQWKFYARYFNDNCYCDDCIWEVAFECNDCQDIESMDDLCRCESCENNFCQSCYDDDECRNNNYQDQDLDFQNGRKTPLITVDRFVGVELEAENGNIDEINLPSTFGIGEDGSLDETGVEIITPPSKNGALVKNIKLACEQLDNAGFEATPACGLHIHIDLRDLKDNFIKLSRILRTFYAVEDVMFAMLPDSRLGNQYCYPLRHNYNFYDFYGRKIAKEFDATLYETKNKEYLTRYKRDRHNSKRYRACNFHSVFYRGTLEIRCHNGTQNPEKILNWIELMLKITDWSINHYKHSTVESLLKLNATKKKVHRMKKIFKFSKKIEEYINSRIKYFNHKGFAINYKLGELPKRKIKK